MDIADVGFRVDTSELEKGTQGLNKMAAAAGGVQTTTAKMGSAVDGTMNQVTKDVNMAATAYNNLGNAATKNKMKLAVNNGSTIANDQMPNRFNTGNIAAQFQDIGVTASMGMNPLLIAIQQGTQLSAILNSMEKPLTGLGIALKSVFNVVSISSIALVALAVAGIQMIDWVSVGKDAINLLASGIEYLIPLVIGLGAALLVMNWSAVVSGATAALAAIGGLTIASGAATTSFAAMAAAWVATPVGALTTAIGLLAAGLAYASGWFDQAGDAVRNWAKDLSDSKQKVSDLSKTINQQTLDLYNQISAMKLHGKERLAYIKEQELVDQITAKHKGTLSELNAEIARQLPAIKQAAEGYANMKTELDLLEESEKKKNKTTAAGAKSPESRYEDIIKGADRKIAALEAERAAIGLTEFATAKLKFETELLNEAQQKNILLTNAGKLEIAAKAEQMALLTDEIRVTKDNLQFAQETTKGFFADMRSGLEQGKSAWESFGNAVRNVLNKIVDSMINANIDKMFGGGGSGGGGGLSLLGSLAGGIGGLFGGQGTLSRIATFGSASGVGPIPMAKGGVFTNGIYNKTTPFAFAGGGAFGVMGEAGPEAVMPLHRGSDGSLGVKMSGAGNDNGSTEAGNTYYIDARGADQGAVARVEQALLLYAGPGVVERRVMNAQTRGAL